MSKDKFIIEDGNVKTPYPIYPNEVRDDESSLGTMKNTEVSSQNVIMTNEDDSKFSFSLIEKKLLQVSHS